MDIREEILKSITQSLVVASIIADEDGLIAGTSYARQEIERLQLNLLMLAADGFAVRRGDEIARFQGHPKQILMAEETVMGMLAKPSGIATSANRFVRAVGSRPQIVCGAWKKMPSSLKNMVREAVVTGGASPRIVSGQFAYLDKNYVKLLGGIKNCLTAVAHLNGIARVIQVKGHFADIASEACEAAKYGADVIFVDSASSDDLSRVSAKLREADLRQRVRLAFGGGINMAAIERLKNMDVDILDIGRSIIDAPLLDMKMEIADVGK